jgi:hypothetical protein
MRGFAAVANARTPKDDTTVPILPMFFCRTPRSKLSVEDGVHRDERSRMSRALWEQQHRPSSDVDRGDGWPSEGYLIEQAHLALLFGSCRDTSLITSSTRGAIASLAF